ncbi:MAG TPA: BatA domain-containing protein, partial [Stellaceae bacterium]
MLALGSLAFASPWLLAALAALPVIWWLLRVTPPAPRRIVFPAIRLLFGLIPREETPARTPWWLILLRTVLAALVVLALAHPVLNPQNRLAGTGPVALVLDDGWSAARDWSRRQTAALDILAEAEREDRQIILVTTAPLASDEAPAPLKPVRAADARAAVQALQPKPWATDRATALKRLESMPLPQGGAALWIGDGIDDGSATPLGAYLARQGELRYVGAPDGEMARLIAAGGSPSEMAGRDMSVLVRSLPAAAPQPLTVRASAEDGALLAREPATIAPGEVSTTVRLPLPTELRNRVARIEIEGEDSAGAVLLVDERWRRRPVGVAAAPNTAGQPLLSENYYLERALGPFTEVRRGRAADLLKREIAVLVYADAGPDSPAEEDAIRKWVKAGGLLLRFAGPRLAEQSDHLLPVRLRRGGRTLGGALSWEKPAKLAPFAAESPFAGLAIPPDVTVARQVLAEPDLDLATKTWARLADGTPLVTAEKRGEGWVVLVHTSANAEWSNLALSGLFVEMLRRVV